MHSQMRELAGGVKLNESIYKSTGRAREPHRVVESPRASNSGVVTPADKRRLDRGLP